MIKIKLLLIIPLLAVFSLHPEAERVGFLFAHGIGNTREQIRSYQQGNNGHWYIVGELSESFDFPEVENGRVNRKKANLGQEDDIKALESAHQRFCAPGAKANKAVIIGVTRGAAAALNYAAQNPRGIKALVLEATFDTPETCMMYMLKRYHVSWVPGFKKAARRFGRSRYQGYNKLGIKPIESVAKIDKNLPILFIHSKKDAFVPAESSRILYNKLKAQGHEHVYLLELESGNNDNYYQGADAFKYQATVHAFYAKYGIDHNAHYAALGKPFLEKCRP